MAQPTLLVIGKLEEQLPAGVAAGGGLAFASDPKSAAEALTNSHLSPEVIVLAESRPGQFSGDAIDTLRRLAPLARIHRLLGTWCEGEQRSGRPPAGCTNSYWHQWRLRTERELARAADGFCPVWGLPATAGADEQVLAISNEPLSRASGLVAICACQTQAAKSLADACRLAGYVPFVVRDDQRWAAPTAVAILWDATVEQIADREEVNAVRQSAGGAPLIALVGFPRDEDCRGAEAAGVAAVVSKPFLIHDLLWELSDVISAGSRTVH